MNDRDSHTPTPSPAKRTGLQRRSIRLLLGLLVVAVAVRVALPEVLRRVAVSQADKALIGRIEIDDVDLALLRGGITLKGLRVYANDLPTTDTEQPQSEEATSMARSAAQDAPSSVPAPQANDEQAQPDGTPSAASPSTANQPQNAETEQVSGTPAETADAASDPMFSADRLSVDIGWRPLFDKIVELQAVELDHFQTRIDRLPNGTIVVPQPTPAQSEPVLDEPAPESESPGWGVLLQRVSLRDGTIRFRDFTLDPNAKPLEATIPSLDASNMALLVSDTGLQPGTVSLDADVLGGHLTVELTQRTLPAGPAFQSHIVLTDLPISDARLYIPKLQWTSLEGRLDIDLHHSFEPEGPHDLSGIVTLRDMSIRVADLNAPPLAWKKLGVEIADIDIVGHDAKIAQVAVDGAHVILRASGPEPVPVLRGLLAGEEPGKSAAPASTPAPADPSDSSAPWTWRLEKVSVRDATVDVRGGDPPLVLGLGSELTNLSSAPKTRSNLTLNVKPPDGTLALTGALTIDPIGFDGRLRLDEVSLPPLSSPVASAITRLLRRGSLSSDLQIAVGATPDAPTDGAKVTGTLSLNDVAIAGEDDKAFAVRWKHLALDVQSILAPGALAKDTATRAEQPLVIALSSVTLERPEFVVTRTEKGIALPEALSSPSTAESQAEATGPDTEKPTEAEANDAASPETSTPIDVRVGRLAIDKMRVALTDKTVKPMYRSSLDPIDFKATDVRWPGPYATGVTLVARGLEGAKLSVTGNVAPTASKIDVALDGLPLAPLRPYGAMRGYALSGGMASLHTNIKLTGEDYETDNKLVLNKLQMTAKESDSIFAEQFGMPLSLALALMTDLEGNITLNLPVSGGRGGTSVGIGTAIRDALKQAILSTATSPLKLIGAVAQIGQKPSSLTPQPVAFALGRSREADSEAEKVKLLGTFLASSPGLTLRLHGETSDDDRRWLAEQKLRVKLEDESGFLGAVRHIGEGEDREAALAFLQARGEDKPAALPEENKPWFENQVAKQQVSDTELRALAQQRAETVRDHLLSNKNVVPERVVIDTIAPEDLAARPAVAITLETASSTQKAAAPPP